MSRHDREAKLEALYGGGPDGMVLVTEHGGRKRDARKTLQDRMSKMMATIPNPASDVHQPSDAPMMGSYQKGTLGDIFETVLSAPDSGPREPDLRKYGPAAASTFPLTAGSLLAAKIRGLKTEETPEGAYRIERDVPAEGNYGQALGEAIWMNPDLTEQQDKGVYEHELGHVSQARDWGILFPIANAAEQLRALMTGEDPQDTRFEQTATGKGKQLLGGGN